MSTPGFVGNVVPTQDQEQQILTQTKALEGSIREWAVMLTPAQRASLLRPRGADDELIDLVAGLAADRGVTLPKMPLEALKSDLQVGRTAARVERQLEIVHQLVSDTRLAGYGEAWEAFLSYYGVLSSMAERDADLAKELAPVTAFMGRRRSRPAPKPE
jgi:hypothetical protein